MVTLDMTRCWDCWYFGLEGYPACPKCATPEQRAINEEVVKRALQGWKPQKLDLAHIKKDPRNPEE